MSNKSKYESPTASPLSMDVEGFICSSDVVFSLYVDEYTNMSSKDPEDQVLVFGD